MRVLATLFAVLTAISLSGVRAHAAQAMRAQDFVESVGVNVHMRYTDSSYVKPEAVLAALRFLNVTHVRDAPFNPRMQAQAQIAYRQLFANGIKFNFFIQNHIPENLQTMRELRAEFPRLFPSIEGPNEVNNFPVTYNGLAGHAGGAAFQEALYDAVKADPVLKDLPVYNFSDWPPTAGKSDFANIHPYPKRGEQPYREMAAEVAGQTKVMPGKPSVITETGYYTLPGPHGWGGVDEATQAKFIVNLLLDAAHLGVRRTYIYQLFDGYPDPKGNDQERHFGLVDVSYKPKPAARAIRNLLLQLKDQGADALSFSPTPLNYTLSNLPPTAKSLLLQKSDGWKIIIIWNEPDIWNEKEYRSIPIAPADVTLTLEQPRQSVTFYDPVTDTPGPVPVHGAKNITFQIADTPVLIALSPE